MNERLPGKGLNSPLLDRLISIGIKGGQFADGSQKDGFLKYERGRPGGVLDLETRAYVSFADIAGRGDGKLGALPGQAKPWKSVIQLPDRAKALDAYFGELRTMTTPGAKLARTYGWTSKDIGLGLVRDGVAAGDEDVNTVLLTGFYHAYGPINSYFD